MWTVLTWALVPVLSIKYGVNGAAFSYLLIGSSSAVVFYIVKKYLNWSIYHSVIVPLLSSLVMGATLFILKSVLPIGEVKTLVILILVGGVTYLVSLYLVLGKSLIEDVKKIYLSILKK